MDMKNIIAIGAAVVLVLGGYGVYALRSSSTPVTSLKTTDGNTEAPSSADAEFLSIITNLKNLNIDTALLADPLFRNLSDFGVVLVEEPLRRGNPFLPGAGAAASAVAFPSQTPRR